MDKLQREYHARFDIPLHDWLDYYQREVVFAQVSWMGVTTQKNVLDCWIYQEILFEVRPDVVIEIGSNTGGSTLFFAHMLDLLGTGQVLSIEIDRSHYHVEHPRIVTLTGDSASPEIVREAHAFCVGKSVLIVHDGDHFASQVLKDMNAYADLVTVGSYFIVEDGIVDVSDVGGDYIKPGEGPLVAIEEFLRMHPDFGVDARRERNILTYNPQGYLKRLR